MYFDHVQTLEELKREYHILALQNHPDRGGNVETMKRINMEYDVVFKEVKDVHYSYIKKETFHKESKEGPDDFKDLIGKLIKMPGLTIEIIGCFVWVGGETRKHKDQLKALGFHWSRTKLKWYKSPEGYHRYGNREYSYSEIRGMYGVQGKYQSEDQKQIE